MNFIGLKRAWMEKQAETPDLFIMTDSSNDQFNTMNKAKPHGAASLKPPKKWMHQMVAKIKRENPDAKDPEAVAGHIWYNEMSTKKRSQKRKAEGKKYGPAPAQKAMVPASDAELLGKTDKEKEEEKKKACKGCPDEAKKSLMEMTAGPGVKSATKKAEAKDEDEEKKKEKLARVIKEGTEVKKCSVEAGGFFPHHYDQNNPDKKWHEDFVGTTWEAEAKQLELDYAGIQLGITRMRLLAEKADLRRRELEMLFDAAKAAVGAK